MQINMITQSSLMNCSDSVMGIGHQARPTLNNRGLSRHVMCALRKPRQAFYHYFELFNCLCEKLITYMYYLFRPAQVVG